MLFLKNVLNLLFLSFSSPKISYLTNIDTARSKIEKLASHHAREKKPKCQSSHKVEYVEATEVEPAVQSLLPGVRN